PRSQAPPGNALPARLCLAARPAGGACRQCVPRRSLGTRLHACGKLLLRFRSPSRKIRTRRVQSPPDILFSEAAMYRSVLLVLASFVVVSGMSLAQNGAETETKKILDRAADALGGRDKLAQYHGTSWKGKGKFRQSNIAVVFDGEAFI